MPRKPAPPVTKIWEPCGASCLMGVTTRTLNQASSFATLLTFRVCSRTMRTLTVRSGLRFVSILCVLAHAVWCAAPLQPARFSINEEDRHVAGHTTDSYLSDSRSTQGHPAFDEIPVLSASLPSFGRFEVPVETLRGGSPYLRSATGSSWFVRGPPSTSRV